MVNTPDIIKYRKYGQKYKNWTKEETPAQTENIIK